MSKKKKSLADMKKEAMKKLQSKAPEIIQQTDEKAAGDGSSHGESIPLPIKDMGIYRENLLPAGRERFIVSAFFTPNEMRYYKFAQRLLTSCIRYGLPYSVYQIPDVHSTISLNGCDDPAFTKANFIAYNMARFPDKNILYVDVDVVFVEYPVRISEISEKGYDFAIYNWLGDEQNAGYSPLYKEAEGRRIVTEQYILTHYVPYYCPDQLRCSGGVQFYRNCPEVKIFLKAWLNVIAQSPYAADDECLDYTYNNPGSPSVKLNPVWLDKSYLRLPHWPHVRPVILHPGVPKEQKRMRLKDSFYPEKCPQRDPVYPFPLGYIIDTRNKLLINEDPEVTDTQKIDQDFWIYHEDIE